MKPLKDQMREMVDLVDLSSNKIRVSDIQRCTCEFHKRYPGKSFAGCRCSVSFCSKVVPAVIETVVCPECSGSGTVKKKRAKEQ